MQKIEEYINSGKTLIMDGGMGTLMAQLGGSMDSSENNTLYPQVVTKAHRLYIEAGSNSITTNTFSLNSIIAAKHGMTEEAVRDSLYRAMELAVAAAEDKCWVLGDLGPCGEMLAPLGKAQPEMLQEAFTAQAQVMAEYPIAAFIIETVFDLAEAQIIMEVCRKTAPDIPVLLSMTYSGTKRGGCTVMGNTAAKIGEAAAKAGVIAVGGNCGDLSPQEYALIVTSLKDACQLPVLIQANAGKPTLHGGVLSYPLQPEDFAEQMEACYEVGARLLGGCCGTTPEHIQALSARFGDR